VPPREPFDTPEQEKQYPEPSMFGMLPAYGFFIRHAKGIELNNVEVGFMEEDRRPAFVLEPSQRRRLSAREGAEGRGRFDHRAQRTSRTSRPVLYTAAGRAGFEGRPARDVSDSRLYQKKETECRRLFWFAAPPWRFHWAHAPQHSTSRRSRQGRCKTQDRDAINKAIDAAEAAGGGTVYFPAGTYVTGSIRLRSNITLQLEHGSVIEASTDATAYDAAEPNQWDKFQDFGHSHWHNSLIWGDGLENVSIVGEGLITGKALVRERGGGGDKAIALKLCRNVTLRDFLRAHRRALWNSGNRRR